MLAKYFNSFISIFKLYNYQTIHRWYFKKLSILRAESKGESGILLTQLVRDYNYNLKIATTSKILAEKNNLKVSIYEVLINWKFKKNWTGNIFEAFLKIINKNIFERICLSFAEKPVFSVDWKYHDQAFISGKLDAIKKKLDINKPEEILNLKFDNISVGDLIYDTYLRYFHKPTIKVIDDDVFKTIEKGLNAFYNFKMFLALNDVKILLTTYTTYIHHGIVTRLCLNNNIPTYTLAWNNYILQKLTVNYPYHAKNHTLFDPKKKLTTAQLALAKNKIESRLSGKIDEATAYMRNSAYLKGKENKKLIENFSVNPRNIVIYMHDFFDSPHVNRSLQFPDLYLFLKEVLDELLTIKSTSVFIKIHPNGVEGVKEIAIALIESYNAPHFFIIDETVSNLNIVECKPDLICTARGTIGIEMAYLGFPVVALYDNTYSNFNFVDTCLTKHRYFSILRGEESTKIDLNKEQILSFYFQAYIEGSTTNNNNAFYYAELFKADPSSNKYLKLLKGNDFDTYLNNTVKTISDYVDKHLKIL